ncbi:hypothetical protein niasHS_008717 [Heterodera schachtii]|uniref:Uncharacterized protein n=1 Tax=Heterodera schachtii TaxID=97005 RepID=A0ABD2IW58_HETSC
MASAPNSGPNTAALAEQERQRTLVFIGLPESNAIRPSERVQEDREATTKILDHLEVEAEPTAVFRLGRFDPQRTTPRPLKNMARLFVRPALTKDQLKKEYEERVRKRQQNPAPVAPAKQPPQTNVPTPAKENGPEPKEDSENTSKSSKVAKTFAQNENPDPFDQFLLTMEKFQKPFPQCFKK